MKSWLKITLSVVATLALMALLGAGGLWLFIKSQRTPSGGVLPPIMAAYDVRHVALDVAIEPARKSIAGVAETTVRVVSGVETFVLDLDHRLTVTEVTVDGGPAPYAQRSNRLLVKLERPWDRGQVHRVRVRYGGRPKEALWAPWIGGFVWGTTESGEPWVGVACQEDGADIWWPCKDHPSDEPEDGMDINLTVPTGLVGLSNGRPLGSTDNGDGTTTSHWRVSYPINHYNVTVNVAPYVAIEEPYHGIDGDLDLPIVFWAIPEHEDEARAMWKQGPRILEVLGRRFGEYPFLEDKYWVAEAPYLGMEHQTLVAYGADFTDNDYGFDWLLLHETGHEWWGNKVTVSDWADYWLHEGFTVYAEAIYVNDTLGLEQSLDYMREVRQRVSNSKPVVQGRDLDSIVSYTGDVYSKGACILHTLRWLIGDELFFEILYDFLHDPRYAYRTATSEDFCDFVEAAADRDLGWFWQRYLYERELPSWTTRREVSDDGDTILMEWDDPTFELDIPVVVGVATYRIDMSAGRGEILVPTGAELIVDPDGWLLVEESSS